MNYKQVLTVWLTVLLIAGAVTAALAQEGVGEISGNVFYDEDGDGDCLDAAVGVEGIPVQVLNRDNNTTINLITEVEGGYFTDGLDDGTWQVTVNPGADYRVTTQQTIEVVLSGEEFVANVDFCVIEVNDTGNAIPGDTISGGVSPTPTSSPQVLPESGAPLAPGLLLATLAGLALLLGGGMLLAISSRK